MEREVRLEEEKGEVGERSRGWEEVDGGDEEIIFLFTFFFNCNYNLYFNPMCVFCIFSVSTLAFVSTSANRV